MKYLLDTCFVSELSKPAPDVGALAWFDSVPEENLYLSAMSVGEIRYGIERLPEGPKKIQLSEWFDQLLRAYTDSIFSIDRSVTDLWGKERARLTAEGKTPGVVDALIACTAITNEAVLVTRNSGDFEGFQVKLLNPWSGVAGGD